MRILELNFEKTWRGGERQTLYNMTGFRNRGLEVALVCRKNTPLEKAAISQGFKVFAFTGIVALSRFLATKGKDFDIMHAQTAQVLTWCVLTKALHRCKIVYTRRVNFIPKGKLTRWKYLQTDALVAISHSVQKIVADFTGKNNIHLISSAVLPVTLNAERAKLLLPQLKIEGKKIIATTAALTAEKGPFVALETIEKLSAQRSDIAFLHFGGGDLAEEMKQAIKNKNLEDIYFMLGHVDEVEDYFSIMDVFLMSSFNEGLGSSVLDAFFNKVPVVSSNAGGLADLVEEGRAMVAKPGDATAMADGIQFLLNNPDKALIQAGLAYEFAFKHHNLVSITDDYITVFDTLIKKD
jgi:glycosyltransferase involved in cell wall biosynthesis